MNNTKENQLIFERYVKESNGSIDLDILQSKYRYNIDNMDTSAEDFMDEDGVITHQSIAGDMEYFFRDPENTNLPTAFAGKRIYYYEFDYSDLEAEDRELREKVDKIFNLLDMSSEPNTVEEMIDSINTIALKLDTPS